jgi:hypothetical protein
MGNRPRSPFLRTSFGQIELRPVAAPAGAPAGMQAYVLLPDLEDLLGVPGFGLRNPIRVSGRKPAQRDRASLGPALPGTSIH